MTNAFEEQDKPIEDLPMVETPELDIQIKQVQDVIEGLRGLGLHRTAAINQPKLDRLLREKRELQEG